MKIKLQARGLWDAVCYGDADFQEDRMALDAIVNAVPEEMIESLAVKESAEDAWDAIATVRIGTDRIQKSTLQKKWRKWDRITFQDGESVDDFALRLSGLMNTFLMLGDDDINE
uniref:Uncharacterized protein n=1 Tax=Arundo donax TaxID=35708 RepID=A0A0A8YF23_ARUDO